MLAEAASSSTTAVCRSSSWTTSCSSRITTSSATTRSEATDKITKKQQPTQLAINDYEGGAHHAEAAQFYGDTGEFWWDYDESSWTDGWVWQYDDGTVLFQLEPEDDYDNYWDNYDDNNENWCEDEGWGDDGSWYDPSSPDADAQ